MPFKIVLLPPGVQPRWEQQIREAVPGAEVTVCARPEEAVEAIVDADAAYGTLPPDLLRRAARHLLGRTDAPLSELPADDELRFHYRIVIADGEWSRERIEGYVASRGGS